MGQKWSEEDYKRLDEQILPHTKSSCGNSERVWRGLFADKSTTRNVETLAADGSGVIPSCTQIEPSIRIPASRCLLRSSRGAAFQIPPERKRAVGEAPTARTSIAHRVPPLAADRDFDRLVAPWRLWRGR